MSEQSMDETVIEVLEGLEAVRKRPEMYAGPLDDPLTPTRLLQEAMCLALDDAVCGACTRIVVTIHSDGSATVADNGCGVSIAPGKHGISAAEIIMTVLHACRSQKVNRQAGDLACGVGMAVMNALSESCSLTTLFEGRRWRQQYRQGVPQGPFEPVPGDSAPGTTIYLKPDPSLFGAVSFDASALADWLRGLDLPISDTTVSIVDQQTGRDLTIRLKE